MEHHNLDGVIALDKLKDHYKHCIRLSASNKINPKNAFDLQLIDYMQDLVSSSEDGQMNFKIASSALDVGAKIYSNRVDCIQSEAQKVASSILMALDGQKGSGDNLDVSNADNNQSGGSEQLNENGEGEEGAQSRAKRKTKRNVKTVIEDESQLDGKLEQMVLGDPFLDGLSQDYDMSCPAALICYNALTQPNCLLTIDSSNLRKDYRDGSEKLPIENHNLVTLIKKNTNCAQIIRDNLTKQMCPRLQNFLFNDRTTKISGLETNLDETIESLPVLNSTHLAPDGGAHVFDPEQYDDGVGNDDYSDAADDGQADGQNENDLIPELDKIAASKPSEYVYSTEHHRLLNTWAGPYAWKVAKAPQTAKKDPKSTRKRVKFEQLPIDWSEQSEPINEDIVDKPLRHSADVLRRWSKKPFRPQDHNLNEDTARSVIAHTFLRPEDTYHCMKSPADALKLVDNDHDYATRNGSVDDAPNSPGYGGFDDVHDDSDDEFRADPVVEGNEVALYGADPNTSLTQHADLEFAGEHLIEQPYTVTQVVIPFAKVAKKMDVRKLKHVMWDLLLPPENRAEKSTIEHNDVTMIENGHSESNSVSGDQATMIETTKKTPSPTPSEVRLAFSNLYGELPVRVSSKMAHDLSQPIAFVTLLHLANEKNLKLIPNQDLKDFIIEQDDVTA
uniref:Condensin complex subunit 2 n=1 Tax=Aceria tosichella TaxID=561515 RepID=A0A6G1S3G5_9ACAR